MGLFDNLFKTKPDAADEAVVEAAKRISDTEKARLLEATKTPAATLTARTATVPTAKPGSVPAPRAYSPRSLGQIVTPASARTGDTKSASPRRIKLSGAENPTRPTEVILLLEDVLPRIPMDLLSDSKHDLKRELRFKVEDLSADIARGRAAVPLGRIAAQIPDLLREPVSENDARQVRLPLQKLVEQIGFLPIKQAAAVAETRPAEELPPGPGPALPEPPPPSAEVAQTSPSLRISLPLAAVLRHCPRELIVAELPPIVNEERISFPWSPIEKQLATGAVDVSSVRFIFALPSHLQGYFEAREGVRVPLPFDEIQRNIPTAPAAPVAEPAPAAQETAAVPVESAVIPEAVFARAPAPSPESEAVQPEPALSEGTAEPALPESEPVESVVEPEPPLVPEIVEPPLDLPPPIVAHEPPPLVEPPPVVVEEAAVTPEPEPEAPVVAAAPPIFVPPPLRQSGATLEPESELTAGIESPLTPPNVWMQPPPEIVSRPAAPWPPEVAPPPSPILPVRLVAPPMVRPIVAPPPLFAGEAGEVHAPVIAAPEPVAPPPPPRPLDLQLARAALGLECDVTLAQIGEELIRLPGLSACFLAVRHESAHGGQLPERFEPEAARALARQLASALDGSAEKLGSGLVQHLTIFAEDFCVSFFTQAEATVCAIHRTRAFLPGVRERLAAAAAALAQA